MKEGIMYISIRRYEGFIPERIAELITRIREGFVPIVSAVEGFISFRFVDAGGGVMATISMFKTEAAAEKSNKAAAVWVKENLSEFNPKPPQITAGEVKIDETA
jgi:hypothetical protein